MPRSYVPGIRDTHPSTPVARAKAASIDNEVDSKRLGSLAAPKVPSLDKSPKPAQATTKVEAEVAVKPATVGAPSTKSVDVQTPIDAMAVADRVNAAAPSQSAEPIEPEPPPLSIPHSAKLPSIPVLAALWVVTAAIPAVVVWAVMRNATHVTRHASAPAVVHAAANNNRALNVARSPGEPVEAPKPPAPANEAAPIASTAASTLSAPTADSASLPASTVPVVVQTESQDRVSVLVKSKPKSAKVYKRGKEIGRTPLIIQIGRGEHRIFEVGVNLGATRRISLDGEKPEITVTLVTEPKPVPSAMPTPPSE